MGADTWSIVFIASGRMLARTRRWSLADRVATNQTLTASVIYFCPLLHLNVLQGKRRCRRECPLLWRPTLKCTLRLSGCNRLALARRVATTTPTPTTAATTPITIWMGAPTQTRVPRYRAETAPWRRRPNPSRAGPPSTPLATAWASWSRTRRACGRRGFACT